MDVCRFVSDVTLGSPFQNGPQTPVIHLLHRYVEMSGGPLALAQAPTAIT